jgi:predicted acetyltransferase
LEIRVLTEEHYLQSMKLSMYAFQYQVPEAEVPKRLEALKKHRLLGIFEGEELASKLHILSLKVKLGRVEWKMGGIAGVATYPEHRRKGHVNALMERALSDMEENGDVVSFLHPFNINFYRRYGWEIISDYKRVQVEKKDLKPIGKLKGKIKRFTEETHTQEIEQIYERFAERHSAMLSRDQDWWKKNIYGPQTAAVYYTDDNEAAGYILYEVKDQVMKVEEYVSLNQEARLGLWNFICQHDSMIEKAEIQTSVHDPFPYFLNEPKQKTEIHPYFMGRIVNAEKALRSYPFTGEGSNVFLHLNDSLAHWNNGTFLIGKNEVSYFPVKHDSICTKPAERGLHLDVNSLTAILFGYKRPIELFEMAKIQGKIEEVMELEKKIPPFKPFFYDFF